MDFKAEWRSQFSMEATSPERFRALDGSERRVAMMRQIDRFNFSRDDGFQAVELPYRGDRMSMVIMLHDEGTYRNFESSLNLSLMNRVLESMKAHRLRLTMSKFEMEATFNLSDTLAAIGMADAFGATRADFQGMDAVSCPMEPGGCLWISDVAHNAFVSVDDAAAACEMYSLTTIASP